MVEPTAGRRGVWLVARREIVERGRERSFLVSTVLSVVVLAGILLAPSALGLDGDAKRTLAVAGVPATVVAELERRAPAYGIDLTIERTTGPAAARAAVDDGADAALIGDRELAAPQAPDDDLALLVQATVRDAATARALRERGAPPREVAAILDPAPVEQRALDPGGDDDAAAVAFVVVLVLYFQLIGFGYWVASAVVEEKSSRVVELLLATLRPSQLLAGKLLGIGALGLVQIIGMAGIGLGAALATGTVDIPDSAGTAVVTVVPWFLLGYAFYATLFALAAALVARQEELQSVTTPLTLVLVAAFFLSFSAQQEPDGGLAQVASLAPPTAPLLMPSRIIQESVAVWEVALAAGLLVAAVALLVPLAGRIYSGGLLRTGSRTSLREAWVSARS